MSAPESRTLHAICGQLKAALVAYERDVAALVRVPHDSELYRRVAAQMDQMRLYASTLPSLSVPWVEFMISHFELAHAINRVQQGADVNLDLMRSHVGFAVAHLSRKCTQLQPAG